MKPLLTLCGLAVSSVLLSGCMAGMTKLTPAGTSVLERSIAADTIVCCGSLADLPYQPLTLEASTDLRFDHNTPMFEFTTGKSYFAAFKLPANAVHSTLTLRSLVVSEHVFQPSVLLLNSDFQPVRLFTGDAFPYVAARGFTPDSLYGELQIKQQQISSLQEERYLVIYSTAEQQQGQTRLLHPAKAYAKAKGTEPPNVPDPIARHSAGGLLQLRLSSQGSVSLGEVLLKPLLSRSTAQPSVGPSVPVAPQKELTLLPETEQFYRRQIELALERKDLSKALQLAEEARRLGATQVRQYLLERLQVR